jgi:deoxyribose-phosphate aldolase
MTPEMEQAGSSGAQRRRLASAIEHTLLRADATAHDIEALCAEARHYGFHCVCVNGSRVALAYELLQESGVYVASTVGFPSELLIRMPNDTRRRRPSTMARTRSMS